MRNIYFAWLKNKKRSSQRRVLAKKKQVAKSEGSLIKDLTPLAIGGALIYFLFIRKSEGSSTGETIGSKVLDTFGNIGDTFSSGAGIIEGISEVGKNVFGDVEDIVQGGINRPDDPKVIANRARTQATLDFFRRNLNVNSSKAAANRARTERSIEGVKTFFVRNLNTNSSLAQANRARTDDLLSSLKGFFVRHINQ